jgi:hypothetical protein
MTLNDLYTLLCDRRDIQKPAPILPVSWPRGGRNHSRRIGEEPSEVILAAKAQGDQRLSKRSRTSPITSWFCWLPPDHPVNIEAEPNGDTVDLKMDAVTTSVVQTQLVATVTTNACNFIRWIEFHRQRPASNGHGPELKMHSAPQTEKNDPSL